MPPKKKRKTNEKEIERVIEARVIEERVEKVIKIIKTVLNGQSELWECSQIALLQDPHNF